MSQPKENFPGEEPAWLETNADQRISICHDCSIGRGRNNTITLDSQKVSRQHALIHWQNGCEFWLIDLGSSNGTYLNHRRLAAPTLLRDGDKFIIGETEFNFHQTSDAEALYRTNLARTLPSIETSRCWLLLADIEHFTALSQRLPPESLSEIVGNWLANCKDAIERCGGCIDKYLGDGFLAFWHKERCSADEIVTALQALEQLQRKEQPGFRVVLHLGDVAIGGMPSLGETPLLGRDLNFLFRVEKSASRLREHRVATVSAVEALGQRIEATTLGSHSLDGFEGKNELFRFGLKNTPP